MTIKKLELDFGLVTIMESILISELKEGIVFGPEENQKLLDLGLELFEGRPYGYISHRVNSYSVDPMVYIDSANAKNLHAIAVVSQNEITRLNAEKVERKFYKNSNSFEVFNDLNKAIEWIKQQI